MPVRTQAPVPAQAGQLVEIQRSRLLAGAVAAIEELGYEQATVEHITSRARVSRRTFYELFENREGCLTALFDDVVDSIEGELRAAGLDGLGWRERVRGGLWTILSFFDREPVLARACMVGASRGGPGVGERREELFARLTAVIDEGRTAGPRGAECAPLTAEGLVGAAFVIVHARLSHGRRREPLVGLVGELMSLIVLPYLGPRAARRELAGRARAPGRAVNGAQPGPQSVRDPLGGVPMRLTLRTARVLEAVAELPGVSNRVVAERAGVSDPGQISKLLARLERLGLIVNSGGGHAKGEPNAWSLTAKGRQVAQSIHSHAGREARGRAA